MIDKFLKAKHWQIFLITFGLPFLIQILTIPMTISDNDPTLLIGLFPVVMIFL